MYLLKISKQAVSVYAVRLVFITAAYCLAPAYEISVYDYSQIIFSSVLSYLCFGQLADIWSFFGYRIICISSVIMAITQY